MTQIEQLEHDLKMADITNGKLVGLVERIEKITREEDEAHVAMSMIEDEIRKWRGIPSHDDLLDSMVGEAEELDETQIIDVEPA